MPCPTPSAPPRGQSREMARYERTPHRRHPKPGSRARPPAPRCRGGPGSPRRPARRGSARCCGGSGRGPSPAYRQESNPRPAVDGGHRRGGHRRAHGAAVGGVGAVRGERARRGRRPGAGAGPGRAPGGAVARRAAAGCGALPGRDGPDERRPADRRRAAPCLWALSTFDAPAAVLADYDAFWSPQATPEAGVGQVLDVDLDDPSWEVAAPSAATDGTVTVGRGDTAWSLAADHLGDGARWREIWEANRTQTQPGGDRVGRRGPARPGGVDARHPGARWAGPASPPAPPVQTLAAAPAVAAEVTVQPGDNFWDLAEGQLTEAWGRAPDRRRGRRPLAGAGRDQP